MKLTVENPSRQHAVLYYRVPFDQGRVITTDIPFGVTTVFETHATHTRKDQQDEDEFNILSQIDEQCRVLGLKLTQS